MNLLLLICVCLLSCEIATAADPEPEKSATPTTTAKATTPASTMQPGTSPPLIRTTAKSSQNVPKLGYASCSGWCLHKAKPARNLNINVNKTLDDRQLKTLYLIKALIENVDAYPVRVDANLFADKDQYYDRDAPRARSPNFNKNVVRVPTTLFFPYTRAAIKKAILDSGNIYIPNLDRKYAAGKSLPMRGDNAPYAFLWNQPVFSNRFFQSNPLLHTDMKVSFNRKANRVARRKPNLADPYNIDNNKKSFDYTNDIGAPHRRANRIQLKASKLDDFVHNRNNKQRSKIEMAPWQVSQTLGLRGEETMLDHADNTMGDIVAGMKIRSKDPSTFVIGATKNARSKINKWIGPKGRSGKFSNSPDTGVLLKGKTRARAMDLLLKSMVQNFQFGNKRRSYKKLLLTLP